MYRLFMACRKLANFIRKPLSSTGKFISFSKTCSTCNQIRLLSEMIRNEAPNTAYLIIYPEEKNALFSVNIEIPAFNKFQKITLFRSFDEHVSRFLQKFDLKLVNICNKIRKKKNSNKFFDISSQLIINGNPLNYMNSVKELSESQGVLEFISLDRTYKVEVNVPWVTKMDLPSWPTEGIEMYPVNFVALYTDQTSCTFNWYRSTSKNPVNLKYAAWEKIGSGFSYTLTNEEVGHVIKLECIPRNSTCEGPPISIVSSIVEPLSSEFYFVERHNFTNLLVAPNKIRIVDYNILADLYATSKDGRQIFNYCETTDLDKHKRYPAIFTELLGYNADVICLQEVEPLVYKILQQILSKKGLEGEFSPKLSPHEGTAIFYNNRKFQWLSAKNYCFGYEIQNNEDLKDLSKNLAQNPNFYMKMISMPHCFQIVILESLYQEKHNLVVANTHLYSSPEFDHVRLLQIAILLECCNLTIEKVKKKWPENKVSLMICGDFNSSPYDGIYELLTTGELSPYHDNWKKDDMKGIDEIRLKHSFKLGSACGTPEYTNYTAKFKGCLDYIFFQWDHLLIDKVIPMPPDEILEKSKGLPNSRFPSDHIPLIVDLEWKS